MMNSLKGTVSTSLHWPPPPLDWKSVQWPSMPGLLWQLVTTPTACSPSPNTRSWRQRRREWWGQQHGADTLQICLWSWVGSLTDEIVNTESSVIFSLYCRLMWQSVAPQEVWAVCGWPTRPQPTQRSAERTLLQLQGVCSLPQARPHNKSHCIYRMTIFQRDLRCSSSTSLKWS